MSQQLVLQTPRTFMRKLCQEDFAALTTILGDCEVMYAWEHAFSAAQIQSWLAENLRRYASDGYSYWAVVLKDSGRMIGVAGLLQEEAAGEDYLGVGYIFHKGFWHQGFALECAQACKDYAFTTLQADLLTASIRLENTASRKLAERLGMSIFKPFVRVYRGKPVAHLLYCCGK